MKVAYDLNYNEELRTYHLDEELKKAQLSLLERALNKIEDVSSIPLVYLDFYNTYIEMLKLMVEKGISPQDLLFTAGYENKQDEFEGMQYLVSKGAVIDEFTFISNLYDSFEDESSEFIDSYLKLFFDNSIFTKDFKFSAEGIYNKISNNSKIIDYFTSVGDTDIFNLLKSIITEGGTVLHMLTNQGDFTALQWLFKNKPELVDINAVDSSGKTALFYVNTPEILEILLENGADRDITDYKGSSWLSSPSLSIINFAIENGYLKPEYKQQILESHFIKGNYEHSHKIFNTGMNISLNVIESFVDAIQLGIANSAENNKLDAMFKFNGKGWC